MTITSQSKKVLIFGATGMFGHTLLRDLSRREQMIVHATARSREGLSHFFPPEVLARIHAPVDIDNFESVVRVFDEVRPDVVINCIGIIKQLSAAKNPLACIAINALLPHRLVKECERTGARLIHISTDCVFSGNRGGYVERDYPDCYDLYGRTKLLGEVDYPNTITLRTSIIGHELGASVSLIDWFLLQELRVRGFTRAIYSGFPTVEMVRIIADYVIPNFDLCGLFHVSSAPVSKFDLLCLVAKIYGKDIGIDPYDDFHCDRSLDSTRFRNATGYFPPSWPNMIEAMYLDYREVLQPVRVL